MSCLLHFHTPILYATCDLFLFYYLTFFCSSMYNLFYKNEKVICAQFYLVLRIAHFVRKFLFNLEHCKIYFVFSLIDLFHLNPKSCFSLIYMSTRTTTLKKRKLADWFTFTLSISIVRYPLIFQHQNLKDKPMSLDSNSRPIMQLARKSSSQHK